MGKLGFGQPDKNNHSHRGDWDELDNKECDQFFHGSFVGWVLSFNEETIEMGFSHPGWKWYDV